MHDLAHQRTAKDDWPRYFSPAATLRMPRDMSKVSEAPRRDQNARVAWQPLMQEHKQALNDTGVYRDGATTQEALGAVSANKLPT